MTRPHLDGSPHGSTAGATTQQALLTDHATRHQQRVTIVGLDPGRHHAAVQNLGDEVVPDAFNLSGEAVPSSLRGLCDAAIINYIIYR